ncbi:MAG TPA: Lrp/AsnC family transcriptional regulator [Candidatus Diapherotrites archaeon]|uniref:Lrp/AsnC family transcriptional regulator n=1 Tax=Candidatus Iainarchaeum sp. TaxID=3101447 RepID=A0A7J4JIE2_9ARCH|nr:Lrp/AsnC family transcriptional regulator [Candidatus Diapherotrites archaeon]HIH17114.1 Lrp/AsnC family transcriptional regulator [Candidatus Diapherotrites archaeon]
MANRVLSPVESRVLQYVARRGLLESERQVAEALRLNHSTVNYIVRKFERERIIQRYKYRLDSRLVNLPQLVWVFVSLKLNRFDIDEFISRLFKHPRVRIVFIVTGDYDLAFKMHARSTEEIIEFMLGIEKEFHHWINGSSIFFVNKSFKQHGKPVGEFDSSFRLSKLDRDVLRLKLADPELSLNAVAANLGVHRNTVSTRWGRLLGEKVVVKKTAIISPDYYGPAGVNFQAIVFLDAVPGRTEELARQLVQFEQVHEVNMISAPHDLMMTVKVADLDAYFEFSSTFFKQPEFNRLITKIKSCVILRGRPSPVTYFYELNGLPD